jgi:hypothetical protein
LRIADAGADEILQLADVPAVNLAGVRDRLLRRPVEIVIGRRIGKRSAVSRGRRFHAAFPLQECGAHQQRGEIAGLAPHDLAQGVECAIHVVEAAADCGEVEPARDTGRVGGNQPLQQYLGRGEIAGAEGLRGRLVQAGGILRHGATILSRA